MQSIGNENTEQLVTAQALREMTVTKDVLFERQKASLLDTFMSSMVKIATEQGGNAYGANLHAQFDPVLLVSITDKLKELGYNTTVESKSDPKMGNFITLAVSW